MCWHSGQTKEALTALHVLNADVLAKKNVNDRLLEVREQHQRRYDALCASVAARLKALPEFERINRYATDGMASWQAGQWDSAKTGFDLAKQQLITPSGESISFQVNEFRKYCLLNGLDDIGLTLQHEKEIVNYEAVHSVS